MTVANYINDLLYRYDCVIVPNFGGFVTNKVGAKVNHFSHTFYPPTKLITFNAHLNHNDGLLANYIASVENISFEEATNSIANTVAKWNVELQSNAVEIASVGKLLLNKDQKLIFTPNTSTNLLTESFGLEKVKSPAISRYKAQVKPLVPVKEEERKGVPAFIKYAATAAILLTLGTLGWNGYQNQQQKEEFAKQQEAVEKKIQSATFVIDNPLPTINLNVTKEEPKLFHVVAGAFEFKENAEKKVRQLKKKGYNAQILGKNKWGLTQVSFDSYATRREATNQLRKIQRNVSSDAWLLIQKFD